MDPRYIQVLFFTTRGYAARVIKWYEGLFLKNVRYNHCSIAFHSSLLDPDILSRACSVGPDEFIVFESTLSGPLNDGIYTTCKDVKLGVQFRPFLPMMDAMKRSGNYVCVSNLCLAAQPRVRKLLNSFIRLNWYRGYQTNLFELAGIHVRRRRRRRYRPPGGRTCCSQLVTEFASYICGGATAVVVDPKTVSPNTVISALGLREPIFLWEV